MHMQYFFAKDCVSISNITIENLLTYDMLEDYFTKMLQGNLFRKFISATMNTPLDQNGDNLSM